MANGTTLVANGSGLASINDDSFNMVPQVSIAMGYWCNGIFHR